MALERHFPEAAQARIAEAVKRAESRSTGQIVPVVVERSQPYEEVRWIAAVVGAALGTGVGELAPFVDSFARLIGVQVAGGLLGYLVGRLGLVERLLAGRRHMDEAVLARAEQAFFEHGLHETREGTGVLVFASLREHRAVVIGDRGIHARMGDAEWKKAVDALVEGLRRDDPARGFEAAIDVVGARLAEHFPRKDGEPVANELPDALRRDR